MFVAVPIKRKDILHKNYSPGLWTGCVEYNSKYFNHSNWKNGVITHLDGKSVAEMWPEIFIFKLGSLGLPIDNRKFRVVKGVEVEMGGVQ